MSVFDRVTSSCTSVYAVGLMVTHPSIDCSGAPASTVLSAVRVVKVGTAGSTTIENVLAATAGKFCSEMETFAVPPAEVVSPVALNARAKTPFCCRTIAGRCEKYSGWSTSTTSGSAVRSPWVTEMNGDTVTTSAPTMVVRPVLGTSSENTGGLGFTVTLKHLSGVVVSVLPSTVYEIDTNTSEDPACEADGVYRTAVLVVDLSAGLPVPLKAYVFETLSCSTTLSLVLVAYEVITLASSTVASPTVAVDSNPAAQVTVGGGGIGLDVVIRVHTRLLSTSPAYTAVTVRLVEPNLVACGVYDSDPSSPKVGGELNRLAS
eukprot:comp22367_c0_seq1/m.54148 comp22367_c0_seq1/g.54148  ORF comp22367_c0_seq1/g.54148 comp22367_c0_seq1/m.54148 type:complete len:319 (+) comp22367_c0_seq1:2049-3005(+)